jgi:hypothetical protein
MWESFKIWLSDHWFEAGVWTVLVVVLAWLASFLPGCATIPVDVDVEQLAERVAAVMVDSTTVASQGGTINEPWTARIMAAGIVVVAGFLAYLLAHRSPAARRAIDAVKGKKCKPS